MDNNCTACGASFDKVSLRRMVVLNGVTSRCCNNCVTGVTPVKPDVWYGYGSGIAHRRKHRVPERHPERRQTDPVLFRAQKAAAMKLAGVHEAGDRVKGMRREDMVPKNRKVYFH